MIKTIISLANELSKMKEPWAVTGGANLFVRKVKPFTEDIDIVTTYNGVLEISNILQSIYIQKSLNKSLSDDKKLKSFYIQFNKNNIRVEVMGDPESYVHTEWVKLDFWKENIEYLIIESISIPTTSLKYESMITSLINESN